MRSVSVRIVTIALFAASNAVAYGQTTQELGLPSPVSYEAVFPNVSFGGNEVELRSELILANPTEEDAFVELQLFDSAGHEAHEDLRPTGWVGSLLETVVRAGTATTFSYPPENYQLKHGLFRGWMRARSNQSIVISHRLHSTNWTTDFQSSVDFLGNIVGTELSRISHIEGFYTTEGEDTGIALVNPGEEEIVLTARQIDVGDDTLLTTEIHLPPSAQKVLFQHEVFGLDANPSHRDNWGGWIEFESNDGSRFASIALWLLNFNGGRYPLLFPLHDPIETEGTQRWDFPVRIVDEFETETLRILVTTFGFYLTDPSLGMIRKFNIIDGESVVGDETARIAVVSGYEGTDDDEVDKAIIFLDSENVLFRKMARDVHSISVLSLNQVELITLTPEVSLGAGAPVRLFVFALIDTEKEEIIATYRRFQGSPVPPIPPWREP
jgi:hypothetical protein